MKMARGWESKSIESGIEDAKQARETPVSDESADEMEKRRVRESLESSRRGVLQQLAATRSDLRRRSLEAALAHLDAKLKGLSNEGLV